MRSVGIIVAAGRGERAGAGLPKQYAPLCGKPMLRWSVEALAAKTDGVVVARDRAHADLFDAAVAGLRVIAADGGATRTDSVRAGLAAAGALTPEIALIHDAARPGLDGAMIERLFGALGAARATAPALPLADAVKRTDGKGAVIGGAPREDVMRVQTPQAFRYADIVAAYAALAPGAALEDDLAVGQAAGIEAQLVPGTAKLMKVTHPEDFALMEMLLGGSFVSVTGSGFDAHRFGPGDHVTLCGVRIAHTRAIIGHSDADVGWHALTDALLGAIGAGDIGLHFPPSDPQWKGADSAVFLRRAAELVRAAGGRIAHVDVTLICEKPKIGPHREAMRARTAEALGLPVARVSVKATTTEAMGFLGREEGLAAQATASVELPR